MVKGSACADCVLERTGTGFVKLSPPVSYDGIKLLIQGEAPLSERTEHWLRRNILQNAGISNSAVLVDFTLRCLAPRNRTGSHYPIGADRAQAESQCRAYDLWNSVPRHIPLLLMGGKAIEQRLGLKSISDYHGHITLLGGRVTGCTYDAESVRKNPNLLPVVIREICNLLEAAQDPAIAVSRPSVHKHEILEPGDKPRVLDLEWDISNDRTTVVGMAESSRSAYSSFSVASALDALRAHKGPLVGHNIVDADLPRCGIRIDSWGPGRIFDTKLVAHLIHPHLAELGLYGLGDLCRMYAPTQDWKQDKGDLLHYNGLDCAYNYRLYEQLCADLDSTQQWHLVEKQQRLAEMTRLMHLRGIKVDSGAIRSFDTQWRTKREEIKAQFEFNPNSPKQVKEYFKSRHGIVLRDTTFKTIDQAAAKHPFLARLRDYKDEGKPISVWFNTAAAEHGFIYPRFNVTGTEVARFSCAGPNCQNIPPYLRHIIVPREMPGLELCSWDFSQIENRCIAKLAQDDVMLADFDSGLDFHRLSASRIFAKRPEEVTDEQRKQGKITIHATNYCETAHHLAERVRGGRTRDDVQFARGLQDAYFRAYPRIKQWQDGIAAQLDSGDLLLRNPWSRVRAIYAQDSHERKKRGCHFLGCSSAAEIVNQRALDVWAELSLLPILVVHDELVYELERGETALRNRISEILNAPVAELGGLRIPAKLKIGVNYGFAN